MTPTEIEEQRKEAAGELATRILTYEQYTLQPGDTDAEVILPGELWKRLVELANKVHP